MKALQENKTGEFIWIQPNIMQRAFVLQSGQEEFGTLQWKSSFGSLAEGVGADVHWTFKRTGFFHPKITVRHYGADAGAAVFTPNWKEEGLLVLASGRSYCWVGSGFWRTQWAFTSATGERLIQFEPVPAFLKSSALVRVAPGGLQTPDLPLLIFLGWYLTVLRSEDEAASAAAGTAGAVACVS